MKPLLILLTMIIPLQLYSQEITISAQAANKIETIESRLSRLSEQKKLKDIVITTITLAAKLPKEDAFKLLQSQYFIDAKKRLEKITKQNQKTIMAIDKQ